MLESDFFNRLLQKSRNRRKFKLIKYNIKKLLGGRLIMDLQSLAKSTVKLDNYELHSMINHFFPNDPKENNLLDNQVKNSMYMIKIIDKMQLLGLTLELS